MSADQLEIEIFSAPSDEQRLGRRRAKDGTVRAEVRIPPRAWLLDRDRIRDAFRDIRRDYGIKIAWPD